MENLSYTVTYISRLSNDEIVPWVLKTYYNTYYTRRFNFIFELLNVRYYLNRKFILYYLIREYEHNQHIMKNNLKQYLIHLQKKVNLLFVSFSIEYYVNIHILPR